MPCQSLACQWVCPVSCPNLVVLMPAHFRFYLRPQADGSSVGVPPSLYDVSPQAQQLMQLVAAVQAETFTYARYAYCAPLGPQHSTHLCDVQCLDAVRGDGGQWTLLT